MAGIDPNVAKKALEALAQKAMEAGDHDTAFATLRKLSEKPGIKTTEFILASVCSVVGTVLCAVPGKEIVGGCLLAAATVAYSLSRGMAKQAVVLFLACSLTLAAGCAPAGYVRADAIEDAVTRVCDRHDRLLEIADVNSMRAVGILTDDLRGDPRPEIESFKMTSMLLKKVIAEAKAAAQN